MGGREHYCVSSYPPMLNVGMSALQMPCAE